MGVPNVFVLRGGLPAWTAAGGAVEQGHPTPQPYGLDAARDRTRTTTVEALKRSLGSSDAPLVLDVDQSDGYARGHVPGATWVCRSRLEARITDVARDRSRPIVVTCADGVMSTLTAATLSGFGYAASVLENGKRAWEAAGGALEAGAKHLADAPDDVVLKPYERGRWAMEAYLRWEEALDQEGWSPHALLEPPART
jgi:rhodanese-related sulfurtransferase